MRRATQADPFAVLGLPAEAGLTDDDVRAAWRRVAAATHPDRADGGDPARFAASAAAYTSLRTQFGRAEALGDLAGPGSGATRRSGAVADGPRDNGALAGRWSWRVRRGRPVRLVLRVVIAAAAILGVILVAGTRPATPALITGALTWLALTARHDVARRDLPRQDPGHLHPGR